MFLAVIVVACLNWQVALNSGGLVTDSGPGVVRIHNPVKIGEPSMVLYGQFQPTVTPQQLQ